MRGHGPHHFQNLLKTKQKSAFHDFSACLNPQNVLALSINNVLRDPCFTSGKNIMQQAFVDLHAKKGLVVQSFSPGLPRRKFF